MEVRAFPIKKYFVMGRDKNYSYDVTYINYFMERNSIFNLEGDALPCTELVEHEIILKSGKIVNIKSYRPPECHKNSDSIC